MTISHKKKKKILHNHPQNTIFLGFSWNFLFPFFSCFLFVFFQHKKDKNKKCTFFFRKPFFRHLDKLPKNIFAHLHTICVFLRYPKKHYKIGEKQAKTNLGPSFDATLDQVLTQKTPNLGPGFDSTAYIYTHIYIYTPKGDIQLSVRIFGVLALVFQKNCLTTWPPKTHPKTL